MRRDTQVEMRVEIIRLCGQRPAKAIDRGVGFAAFQQDRGEIAIIDRVHRVPFQRPADRCACRLELTPLQMNAAQKMQRIAMIGKILQDIATGFPGRIDTAGPMVRNGGGDRRLGWSDRLDLSLASNNPRP